MANKNYKLFYLPSYLQTADKNLSQVFAGSEPHFVPEITLTSQLERAQNRVTQFSQRYFSTQRWSLLMAFSSLLLSALKREAQPFYAIKRGVAVVVHIVERVVQMAIFLLLSAAPKRILLYKIRCTSVHTRKFYCVQLNVVELHIIVRLTG